MRAGSFKRNILIWMMIPTILYLYYNRSANWHFHILSDGRVVEHAHPFQNNQIPGTPFQEHHHSDLAFSILAQLSNITATPEFLMALVALLLLLSFYRSIAPFRLFIPVIDLSTGALRAPPAAAQ